MSSVDGVVTQIREVLAEDADDGVRFDSASVAGREITVETAYVGVRVSFLGDLAGMVLRMQVDVGFGDAVVPEPRWLDYPELLDLGAPRLLGYPPEATLAEKLHAILVLGFANSRMKDYYDLWTACRLGVVTAEGMGDSIRHTFEGRGTALPDVLPEGLTLAFAEDPTKLAQWAGFVRKSQLDAPTLGEVVQVAGRLATMAFVNARSG